MDNKQVAIRVQTPLTDTVVTQLHAGQKVLLSGTIFTARDAAHKRMIEVLTQGQALPIDLQGQTIYYVGPCPAPPGRVIGSAGPTTSGRVDKYTPALLDLGLKGMIGKGSRSPEVKKAMVEHKAVYLASVGGAGALITRSIKKAEVVAYPELGPEAIMALEVENFPATVVNDCYGADLYEEAIARYACK